MAPVNKDHDAQYWRRRYEKMRSSLRSILKLTEDDNAACEDIVHDAEITAYRALYEE